MRYRSLLIAALALLPWGAVAGAQESTLAIEPGFTVSGTPLEVEVTLEGWYDRRPRAVEFFLDGRNLGRRGIEAGTSTVTFEDTVLKTGSHRLEAVSGRVTAESTFRTRAGWLSILPPLLAIGLALLTRDVLISLFLGVFSGALIFTGWDPLAALGRTVDRFLREALADSDHAAILIFTALLGGMVGLLSKSGGTHGIVERLSRFATTVRRGQMSTWAMGVAIFFDDYANTLIVGPTMRPITDRLRISREKLAYIVDSTAAPVVCLIPISTWVGFEIGLINDAFARLDVPTSGYLAFLYSIPYRFYPILALVTVAVVAWTGRDFGPMAAAERRARSRGELLAPGAVPIADYGSAAVEPPAGIPKRARNALLPIATVVVVTLIGLYRSGSAGLERAAGTGLGAWLRDVLANADSYRSLLWASLAGVLVALLLPLVQRLLSIREAMIGLVEGVKAMLMAFMVLLLAWSLGAVCGDLDTAQYLVGLARETLSPAWLPALTFVLAAAIAFATGAAWGTMAILEPLVIPICHNLTIEAGMEFGSPFYTTVMSATIASVLAGAVWGDHCSPISDTTILSSMATGCDHIAHVRTQLPYALGAGLLAITVGCIPAGAFGLRPWVSLLIGIAVIVAAVRIFGRRDDPDPDDEAAAPAVAAERAA